MEIALSRTFNTGETRRQSPAQKYEDQVSKP
jgi:hypothetical protein